uniref:Uncharacterized protein n=1 Tax=Corydalis conspersa TaxID=2182691 RepID=A0A6G8J360_9MAGN|nr:hypothetical protein [Corydalis conspersa]QIM61592.1 hypothetical protein [Corydalis conspersa]
MQRRRRVKPKSRLANVPKAAAAEIAIVSFVTFFETKVIILNAHFFTLSEKNVIQLFIFFSPHLGFDDFNSSFARHFKKKELCPRIQAHINNIVYLHESQHWELKKELLSLLLLRFQQIKLRQLLCKICIKWIQWLVLYINVNSRIFLTCFFNSIKMKVILRFRKKKERKPFFFLSLENLCRISRIIHFFGFQDGRKRKIYGIVVFTPYPRPYITITGSKIIYQAQGSIEFIMNSLWIQHQHIGAFKCLVLELVYLDLAYIIILI